MKTQPKQDKPLSKISIEQRWHNGNNPNKDDDLVNVLVCHRIGYQHAAQIKMLLCLQTTNQNETGSPVAGYDGGTIDHISTYNRRSVCIYAGDDFFRVISNSTRNFIYEGVYARKIIGYFQMLPTNIQFSMWKSFSYLDRNLKIMYIILYLDTLLRQKTWTQRI